MATQLQSLNRDSAALAGDACLFTAALVCLSAGMVPVALVVGVGAAWRLHNRALDRQAIVGGLAGLVAGTAVLGGLVALTVLAAELIGPAGDSEFAVPLGILAVAGTLFAALAVALAIDSLRDLARNRRAHVRLDLARLGALAVIVIAAAAVSLIQAADPASEIGELGIFVLGGAALAAVTAAVGNAMVRYLAQRGRS